MPRKRVTNEQIAFALRQAENGAKYVGRIERGSENVTISTLEAIARVLCVPVAALMTEPVSDAERPSALRAGRKPKG